MSILVVTEQQGGRWHKMSWEALAGGQQIAASLGSTASVVVLGADIEPLAKNLAKYQVDEVFAIDHELLRQYSPEGYVFALRQLLDRVKPSVVLFPHTYQVRDFGPKLAASLGHTFLSDAIGAKHEDGELVFVRRLFQGKLNADVALGGAPPFFVSLQSGTFRADCLKKKAQTDAPVSRIDVAIAAGDIRTRSGEPFRESGSEVDLSSAAIIVSVGRGIKDPENIPVAEALAEALGGELAASRPICDNGWLPLERQVGSSGQTVSPKLYVALGISGAIQHVVGMKGSKTIVAINRDLGAPVFDLADYGIVGDLFEVVPALTKAVRAVRRE